MNKKICIIVTTLLICTSALLILPKEPNVGAMPTKKITLCFDSYDPNEAWETNPEGMLCNGDGLASTTINGDVELLDVNTCPDRSGPITKVELGAYGCYHPFGDSADIILRPVFDGAQDGDDHIFDAPCWWPDSSGWIDITGDTNAPNPWTWTDVEDLDCDVEAENNPFGGWFKLYCAKVQIRVTY